MPHQIRPLQKKSKEGKLYTHRQETLKSLQELLGLDETELEERCKIHHNEQAGYISNACLVYLVRTTGGSERIRSALFVALVVRITSLARQRTRLLPSLYADEIVEAVVSDFVEKLVTERPGYDVALDSLECGFRNTVISDCTDAFRSLRRKEKKRSPLEPDTSDDARLDETQGAIGEASMHEFLNAQTSKALSEAMAALPELHERILKLELMGYPIHSESGEPSMTTILKKSEKTIHKHRQLALKELRQELHGE